MFTVNKDEIEIRSLTARKVTIRGLNHKLDAIQGNLVGGGIGSDLRDFFRAWSNRDVPDLGCRAKVPTWRSR